MTLSSHAPYPWVCLAPSDLVATAPLFRPCTAIGSPPHACMSQSSESQSFLAHTSDFVATARLALAAAPLGSLLHAPQGTNSSCHPARIVRVHDRIFPQRFANNLIYLPSGDQLINKLRPYTASCRPITIPSVAPCHPTKYTPSDLSIPSTHDTVTTSVPRRTVLNRFAGPSPTILFTLQQLADPS